MRIVVAEDSVLFREGLVRLLGDLGHDVVAAVADSTALLAAARAHLPDLAVIDIRMPPGRESDGAHAAATIRRDMPEVGRFSCPSTSERATAWSSSAHPDSATS